MSTPDSPSFAIIEGSLCLLNRRGTVTRRHAPLGRAVEQFIVDGDRLYVRENPDGVLAGMANLYCLDDRLQLLWLADLPDPADGVVGDLRVDGGVLLGSTRGGRAIRLSPSTGRTAAASG